MHDTKQRQASEEISHILRRRKENSVVSDLEQQFLDGSRSADMFVAKRHMGSEGVLHFATPPLGTLVENGQDSDPEEQIHPSMLHDDSLDLLHPDEIRMVTASPSQPLYIRAASIQVRICHFCALAFRVTLSPLPSIPPFLPPAFFPLILTLPIRISL